MTINSSLEAELLFYAGLRIKAENSIVRSHYAKLLSALPNWGRENDECVISKPMQRD